MIEHLSLWQKLISFIRFIILNIFPIPVLSFTFWILFIVFTYQLRNKSFIISWCIELRRRIDWTNFLFPLPPPNLYQIWNKIILWENLKLKSHHEYITYISSTFTRLIFINMFSIFIGFLILSSARNWIIVSNSNFIILISL